MGQSIRKRKTSDSSRTAYQQAYLLATAPWKGGLYKHFATEAEWEAHREGVKQDQEIGTTPF